MEQNNNLDNDSYILGQKEMLMRQKLKVYQILNQGKEDNGDTLPLKIKE